ncbi:hypothetical protein VNO78_08982 [Psophocarpus tetragonolobus]|uniref:Uncharacterized protein n=1 Tax=Psophocarpus tetragonolobus TaxID=3891 RepID=A0AAN9XTC6_PSOTE
MIGMIVSAYVLPTVLSLIGASHRLASPASENLVLLFLLIKLLNHLGLLIIKNDEVLIGNVEAEEVVDGGFGVIDVLINHKHHIVRVLVPHVQHTIHLQRQARVSLPEINSYNRCNVVVDSMVGNVVSTLHSKGRGKEWKEACTT